MQKGLHFVPIFLKTGFLAKSNLPQSFQTNSNPTRSTREAPEVSLCGVSLSFLYSGVSVLSCCPAEDRWAPEGGLPSDFGSRRRRGQAKIRVNSRYR